MSREQRRRGGAHPTQSFENLVSKANQNALRPFIEETVAVQVNLVRNQILRTVMADNNNLNMRLQVLEQLAVEKLGETKESLREKCLELEDQALGVQKTDSPIERGDMVRVEMAVRTSEQPKFSSPMAIMINQLCVPPNPQVEFQTNKDIEESLVGAKAGEAKEIEVTLQNDQKVIYQVKVDRVSRPIPKPNPTPEASPEVSP